MKKLAIYFTTLTFLISCGSKKSDIKAVQENKNQLKQSADSLTNIQTELTETKSFSSSYWISIPTSNSPKCIDTLVLNKKGNSYWYSCEQDFSDSITFDRKEDSTIINLWYLKDEFSGSDEQEIKMVFTYLNKNNLLTLIKLTRKEETNFINIPFDSYQKSFMKIK